jgi:TolB protein
MRSKIKGHRVVFFTFVLALCAAPGRAQEGWFKIRVNLGAQKVRIAVPELPPRSPDEKLVSLTKEFNQVLWSDLDNSGILDLVSKSYYPLKIPHQPQGIDYNAWSNPPVNAQMLVLGDTQLANQNLVVTAYLQDVKNPGSPSALAKRYVAPMNETAARQVAHRLANEIIQLLGGGISGINLTKISFVSKRSGHPEIWIMDYDGYGQHQVTNYQSLSTTPRWSPDNSKLAFTSYASGNPEIYLLSLLSNRRIPFPTYRGLNTTPAWSPDGQKIAFCSSMSSDPEIYVSNVDGSALQRLTFSPGVDISPVWNPKTGNEIAFVSDRSGSPQIYIMSSDGSNLRRLITKGGEASSPSWSPNGLFIAFSWGVPETGTYDIYVIEIATGRIVQLTHDSGANEHPSWSPDGRHLVFESTRTGTREIWSMLADGTHPIQLTQTGQNWNPNWSN